MQNQTHSVQSDLGLHCLQQPVFVNTDALIMAIFSSKKVTFIFDLNVNRWAIVTKTRNAHVKQEYESSISYHSKVMANVQVLLNTNRQTGQILYTPDLLMQGH